MFGIDRLEALPLAAVVHVRHEADQVRRLLHLEVGVAADVVGAGRNVEVVLVRRRGSVVITCFGTYALRIEHDADLGAIGDRLADRVVVHVEADLRARLHQLARALGKTSPFLPTAYSTSVPPPLAAVVVDQRLDRVMHDAARARRRLRFDRLDVAILGQAGVGLEVAPTSRRLRSSTVNAFGIDTIRSGLPMCQRSASSNWRGGGMSAGLPRGAPASTHADDRGDLADRSATDRP